MSDFLPYEVEVVRHNEETPPWVCGDCGYTENRYGTCDWCGQLWELA